MSEVERAQGNINAGLDLTNSTHIFPYNAKSILGASSLFFCY